MVTGTGGFDRRRTLLTLRLILATEMSPISVVNRLTRYLAGSSTLTVYSPYQQILAELLQYTRKDPNYLATQLTESWQRTYQVSQVSSTKQLTDRFCRAVPTL